MAGKRFRSSLARFSSNNDVYVGNIFDGTQLPTPLEATSTGIGALGTGIRIGTSVLNSGTVLVNGIVNTTGVNVFENEVIDISDAGAFNANANGAHNYFINCIIRLSDLGTGPPAPGGAAAAFFGARAGLTPTLRNGFFVGDGASNRPEIITAEATSKGNHFFGCDIVAVGSLARTFILFAGQMEDSTVEYSGSSTSAGSGLQIYPHGGAPQMLNNDFINNGTSANNVWRIQFVLQGNSGFNGNTFVGSSPASLNDLNLVLNGYTNLLIDPASTTIREYYRANATNSWVYSIDPAPRMSLSQAATAAAVAGSGRLIEASSFNQQFTNELGAPTGGITAVLTGDSNFATAGNIRTIQSSTTTTFSRVYRSNSITGYLLGNFDPMSHEEGLNQLDADTPLVIPTFFRDSALVRTDFTNNIELRSFTNVVDATGVINIPITAANQRTRGIGSNQTIGAPGTYSTDTTVSLAARTASNISSYFNTALDTPSPQDISDALKHYHATTTAGNIFTPNALYRTVSGGIMDYGANITLSQAGTVGVITFSSAATGRGSAIVSGITSLSAPADGDVVNEISLLNGGTSVFELDYSNLEIPSGWRFGRAEHVNFGPTTGTIVLDDIFVDQDAELVFERGRTYTLSNSDFTTFGTDFGGWSAAGTTGDVTINIPIGDTSLSAAQEVFVNALTNFNVVRAVAVTTANINLDIPAGASGYASLVNAATGAVTSSVTISAGVASGALRTIRSDDANDWELYYKLDSTISGTIYRTRRLDIDSSAVTGDIAVEPLEVNNFFVSAAATSTTIAAVFPTTAVTDASINLTWTGTSATSRATGAETQGEVLTAANSQVYFNWIVTRRLSGDPIDYRPNSVVWNNSADGVTGIGTTEGVFNVSVNNTTSNFISNASGGLKSLNTNTTGVTQVQSQDEGEASIATVQAAISGTLPNVINTSNVADGVGFLVGNRLGTKGTPPYDRDTAYNTNL